MGALEEPVCPALLGNLRAAPGLLCLPLFQPTHHPRGCLQPWEPSGGARGNGSKPTVSPQPLASLPSTAVCQAPHSSTYRALGGSLLP